MNEQQQILFKKPQPLSLIMLQRPKPGGIQRALQHLLLRHVTKPWPGQLIYSTFCGYIDEHTAYKWALAYEFEQVSDFGFNRPYPICIGPYSKSRKWIVRPRKI